MVEPKPPRAGGAIGWGQLLAYAAPNLAISMLIMPVATVAPALYVKERGVALAMMGVVLMAARIFDGFADQTVGYLSDISQRHLPGGRKFWLVLGALVAAPSVWFLCAPPADAGIVYFTICSLAAYLAWAMLLIPYTAWGAELTRDEGARTRIMTARSISNQIGALLFLIVPLALVGVGLAPTTDMNFAALHYVALGVIALLPLTLAPALLWAPRGVVQPKGAPASLWDALKALATNRPMRILGSAFLVSEFGYGVMTGAVFFYLDAYLGIGAHFSIIIIATSLGLIASLPFWGWLSGKLGRKQALASAWLAQGASFALLSLVPPGEGALYPFMALITFNSFFTGAASTVAPAMLGDIVDYDTLKTKGYRAGNYFALYSLLDKIAIAFGAGIAMVLLGAVGYNVIEPATNGATANLAMLIIFAWTPAVLRIVSVAILWLYPLDARRQSIIRRRLEAREARAKRNLETFT